MNAKVKPNIRHLSQDEITNYFESIGEKKFRVQQVWEWLWQKQAFDFQSMSNLSKDLRTKLEQNFEFTPLAVDATQVSEDGTIKSRFKTFDGHKVEGVLIPTE